MKTSHTERNRREVKRTDGADITEQTSPPNRLCLAVIVNNVDGEYRSIDYLLYIMINACIHRFMDYRYFVQHTFPPSLHLISSQSMYPLSATFERETYMVRSPPCLPVHAQIPA